jgi:hypothetical protein
MGMKTDAELDSDKTAIGKTIHDVIGWALTKDFDLLFSVVAQDADFFIFHPDSTSTIDGFEAFKSFAERSWTNPAFKATRFEIKELNIHLSASGSVAWYSCFLDDFGEWDGREVGWNNARWTGVLEKRNGKWVITQMHFSFPTDRK